MNLSVWFAVLYIFGFASTSGAWAQAAQAKLTTDGIPCSSFRWVPDSNSPTASMLVPITINGQKFEYQLDTGADVLIAYGKTEHKGWVAKQDFIAVKNVQFAGMSLPSFPIFRLKDVGDEDVQGTVGLDILVGHTFIIDFPKRRVCLINRADMPDSLNRAASWTAAEIRGGKLYLDDVVLNGKALDGVIYDSGNSPEELSLDFSLWKVATGKGSGEQATSRKVALTWGKEVEYVSAKATGSLQLGERTYSSPTLTACPSRPTNYHDHANGGSGAFGNALFLNSILILDLGSHPEFGIVSVPQGVK